MVFEVGSLNDEQRPLGPRLEQVDPIVGTVYPSCS
jgi:hypothetical protein